MVGFVPSVRPCSKRELELDARHLAAEYYPSLLTWPGAFPILPFFELILPRDFDLDTGVALLSDGVEGITLPDGQVLVSEETYRRATQQNGRARFTIAHEVCHGIKHRTQIKRALIETGGLVFHRRGDLESFRDPEWQANYFAGTLLMPEPSVRKLYESTLRSALVSKMARIFQVSQKAAEVRLSKLGLN